MYLVGKGETESCPDRIHVFRRPESQGFRRKGLQADSADREAEEVLRAIGSHQSEGADLTRFSP